MEATIAYWGYRGVMETENGNYYRILGLYKDNGKDHGNLVLGSGYTLPAVGLLAVFASVTGLKLCALRHGRPALPRISTTSLAVNAGSICIRRTFVKLTGHCRRYLLLLLFFHLLLVHNFLLPLTSRRSKLAEHGLPLTPKT